MRIHLITLLAALMALPCAIAQADSSMSSDTSSSNSPTLQQYGAKLKTACKSDVDKLCSDVTPGEGRIAACLDSKEDQLSPGCHKEWISTKAEISKRIDKAEVAFRRDCGTDVQKFCANVPSGRGRLWSCLGQHEPDLSNSCQNFQAKLEQKLSEFIG
jgi:Golgi apparatus protein 1